MIDGAEAGRVIRRAIEGCLSDLEQQHRVLVAVSGGADSLALARGVAATGRVMTVGIIDHGLQDGSADTARRAAEQCASMSITDILIETVEVIARGEGPEAAARDARRTGLQSIAERIDAVAILLAHTRDDQAETVLIRLARGSGARSLAAMAPVAGLWRRPLLDVSRDVVRASVADLAPWEDPHNVDPSFVRSRVRHGAMPAIVQALGPDAILGLARSARLLRDDADALDSLAADAAVALTDSDGSLDAQGLLGLPRAIRTRIIKAAAISSGAPASALTFSHVERVEALVSQWHGQGAVDLPGSIAAQRAYGRLVFHRAPPVAARRAADREE